MTFSIDSTSPALILHFEEDGPDGPPQVDSFPSSYANEPSYLNDDEGVLIDDADSDEDSENVSADPLSIPLTSVDIRHPATVFYWWQSPGSPSG
ncbi:hypothetical protein BROUX41_003168 [Berkeleyomyces rouxiae]|uniref:uncharacterized protein n=1 Tax=Berkeleyomyces rouxiae TaxID=2035830 RepID=UPI003B7D0140